MRLLFHGKVETRVQQLHLEKAVVAVVLGKLIVHSRVAADAGVGVILVQIRRSLECRGMFYA